jgi:hypothetical protein
VLVLVLVFVRDVELVLVLVFLLDFVLALVLVQVACFGPDGFEIGWWSVLPRANLLACSKSLPGCSRFSLGCG